jgi:hypothetical protein
VPSANTGGAGAAGASATRQWGTRPGRLGVFTVIGGAFAGLLVTVFLGREPGFALGLCVILATAVGSFAVRPNAAYLVIPAPALSYVVAAVAAGYVHDHASDTSHTALAVSGVQWVANGFIPMAVATGLAILIAAVRWLVSIRRSRPKWAPAASARRQAGTATAKPAQPAEPHGATADLPAAAQEQQRSELSADPQRPV